MNAGEWAAWVGLSVAALAGWGTVRWSRRGVRATERGNDLNAEGIAIQRAQAEKKVDLRLSWVDQTTWQLRNHGVELLGLRLFDEDRASVSMEPFGAAFPENGRHEVYLRSPADPPYFLRFVWDGQDAPHRVSAP